MIVARMVDLPLGIGWATYHPVPVRYGNGVRQQTLDGLLSRGSSGEGQKHSGGRDWAEVYRRLYTANKWRRPADGDFAQGNMTGGRMQRSAGDNCKPAGVR